MWSMWRWTTTPRKQVIIGSISTWYNLADRIFRVICEKVGCKEATPERCRHCPIAVRSNHVDFYYEMKWYFLVKDACFRLRKSHKTDILRAKDFLTRRYMLDYSVGKDQYFILDRWTQKPATGSYTKNYNKAKRHLKWLLSQHHIPIKTNDI